LIRVTTALLLVALALGCSAGKPLAPPTHTFALVGTGGGSDPGGADAVKCLDGRFEQGTPVLLLSDSDSTSCQVKTGEVVGHFISGNPCTILVGADRCKGGYFGVGVLGSQGTYRLGAAPTQLDAATRNKVVEAVAKGHAVETAQARWKVDLGDARYEASISDAVTFPALEGGPSLVRLRVSGDPIGGPWVAIANGQVDSIVGPFTERLPCRFALDGREYLRFDVAVCWGCGGGGTEIHAVEGGKLRRVLKSYANAN